MCMSIYLFFQPQVLSYIRSAHRMDGFLLTLPHPNASSD
jgi:hypothetical protein